MSLAAWTDEPLEEARLLNPAFLGALLWACASGHAQENGSLPYPLAFLALPIVLHRATRTALPRDIRTSLPAWLVAHPRVLVGSEKRAEALVPAIKRSLLFAVHNGLITAVDDGVRAAPRPRAMASFERETTEEVRQCLKKARFISRWFVQAGSAATVMALWGVTL